LTWVVLVGYIPIWFTCP